MNIQIMTTKEMREESVDVLCLGNKATNLLKRLDCMTIEDVLKKWNDFIGYKGIGEGTVNQIKNAVINWMISQLPEDKLVKWFEYLIDYNEPQELKKIFEGFAETDKEEAIA